MFLYQIYLSVTIQSKMNVVNTVNRMVMNKDFRSLDIFFRSIPYQQKMAFMLTPILFTGVNDTNLNSLSGLDIAVQFMVDYDFVKKESMLRFFKKHFSSFNLLEWFLGTPLSNKINSNGKPFFTKVKNIFRFLHKVNTKNTIDASSVVESFHDAFYNYPKDGVSLLKYLIKTGIVNDLNDDKQISVLFYHSSKMARFAFERLGVDTNSAHYIAFYSSILTKLLGNKFDCQVNEVEKYVHVMKDYGYLLCASADEYYKFTEVLGKSLDMYLFGKKFFPYDQDNFALKENVANNVIGLCQTVFDFLGFTTSRNLALSLEKYACTPYFKYRAIKLFYGNDIEFSDLLESFEDFMACGNPDMQEKVYRANLFFEVCPEFRDDLTDFVNFENKINIGVTMSKPNLQ